MKSSVWLKSPLTVASLNLQFSRRKNTDKWARFQFFVCWVARANPLLVRLVCTPHWNLTFDRAASPKANFFLLAGKSAFYVVYGMVLCWQSKSERTSGVFVGVKRRNTGGTTRRLEPMFRQLFLLEPITRQHNSTTTTGHTPHNICCQIKHLASFQSNWLFIAGIHT